MFEAFQELFLEKIRLVWNGDVPGPMDTRALNRQQVLDRLEGVGLSHHRAKRLSAVELASLAVRGDISREWSSIVFAQNYPDREPLSLGLQHILKAHSIPARNFTGLSHLKGAAQIEAVAALDLLMENGERGGVVVAEQLPYSGLCDQRDDGALALSIARGAGPVKILGIARVMDPSLSAEEIWTSLRVTYPGLKLGGGKAVLQTTDAVEAPELPFQAWLELGVQIDRGEIKAGDTVALFASDKARLLCALVLRIDAIPFIETVR